MAFNLQKLCEEKEGFDLKFQLVFFCLLIFLQVIRAIYLMLDKGNIFKSIHYKFIF